VDKLGNISVTRYFICVSNQNFPIHPNFHDNSFLLINTVFHPVQILPWYIHLILASWIHKPSLDLMKNKTKNWIKKNLTDYFFQKLTLKFFLLHRSGNLVLFLHFIPTSENPRKISFMASGIYAKITYIVLIHMGQGRTGLLPLFYTKKWDSNVRRLGHI
jgi:hypothetical protein